MTVADSPFWALLWPAAIGLALFNGIPAWQAALAGFVGGAHATLCIYHWRQLRLKRR